MDVGDEKSTENDRLIRKNAREVIFVFYNTGQAKTDFLSCRVRMFTFYRLLLTLYKIRSKVKG